MSAPLAIEASPDRLDIRWPDGTTALSATALRSACRCGRCRGADALTMADDLSLVDVAPAGTYGLQLIFSDGHDRGIYPWPMLRELSASRP
ncbi:DUF971 domain-containing protein [Piscinibacter terrae]|uniref:DUF971 domain-containing protein n=1 Tax=Piscinibacter terrae TaxID=2496871 RepID=A0A3N7HM65_9BURK|nr:DUF971 domain-containing protein [Albitalea terrae]RQP23200.1 DUF971 domain-containing protein [Albitalea terrae]